MAGGHRDPQRRPPVWTAGRGNSVEFDDRISAYGRYDDDD
jgi:hypothetical protein